MGALAWEQEPPKTHSVSRPFFDRGVGSSILASLSEAGGNDQHSSLSKPLPPRSQTCESRLSECVHVFLILHAVVQSSLFIPLQNRLIFVHLPARLLAVSCAYTWRKSCFGRALSHLGNRPLLSKKFLTHLLCEPSKVDIVISNDDALPIRFRFCGQFMLSRATTLSREPITLDVILF
jgi:hypothetical protein